MGYQKKRGDIKRIKEYMELAAQEALKSTCKKSKRGAVIIKDNKVIGKGYNKVTLEELCNPCIREHIKDNTRLELCPAVHAEQLAILDALNNKESLEGSTLYHIKVKEGKLVPSGKPSCTICSRLIKEAGIKYVVLWHKEGYFTYDTDEFNKLSFDYMLDKIT